MKRKKKTDKLCLFIYIFNYDFSMHYSSGIGTTTSPEETAVKIRARNNFRDKYTQEIEDHQQQKRNKEQGKVWQQEREEATRVRRLREVGQQNRNKQRQDKDRKLQEEQKKDYRRKRKEVERYDKAHQMPDDSYEGNQALEKHQTKQVNIQTTGLPVSRKEGKAQRDGNNRGKRNEQVFDKSPDETNATFYEISLTEDDQTAIFNERKQNVKGKQSGGDIYIIQDDVRNELKSDRKQRSKVRPRAATAPDVTGGIDRNRKQDDMLPKGQRKPIKGIGQPDKNHHEKLELENVKDERRLDVLEKRPRKPEDVKASRVQRVQEIERTKRKRDEKIIHPEIQRKQQESGPEISENGQEVDKVQIHPSDVDPVNRERARTAQD